MGNQISTPKPLEEASSEDRVFTKFPELPIELRLRILDFAAPQNQVVLFQVQQKSIESLLLTAPFSSSVRSVRAPRIAMLSATCETRSTVLKGRKPSFKSWAGKPVYFNPDRDVLVLSGRGALASFEKVVTADAEGKSLRFIALNLSSTPHQYNERPGVSAERDRAEADAAVFRHIMSRNYDAMIRASYFPIRKLLKTCQNLDEIVFMADSCSEDMNATVKSRLENLHHQVHHETEMDPYPCPPDWVDGIVPRMPVFSLLTYNSTAKGIAEMETKLVARRLSAATRPNETEPEGVVEGEVGKGKLGTN